MDVQVHGKGMGRAWQGRKKGVEVIGLGVFFVCAVFVCFADVIRLLGMRRGGLSVGAT